METIKFKLTKKQRESLTQYFKTVRKKYWEMRKKHPSTGLGGGMILAHIKSYSGNVKDAFAEVMYLHPARACTLRKASIDVSPPNKHIRPARLRYDRYNHTLEPSGL